MSHVPRPSTMEEMVEQLWYAVVGSNGDGIAAKTRRHEEHLQRINDQLPLLMTKVEHEGCQDKERRSKWRSTDIVLTVGMLIVAVISAAGVFL